jgi:hypothetical protein
VFREDVGRCPLDSTPLAPLERDPLEGTTLAGRYQIERCVGEGGMGRVYRARHRNLDRVFAVKVIYGDLAANPKMRLRFDREARAASRVDHPHLVSVVDSGATEAGLLYLVMSYVEGYDLSAIIDAEAPLPAERVHRLVRQLCQGLAHAHDQGLVHRDFKGPNVLVTGTGASEHARILDFGLAFLRAEPESSRLTTAGIVMGTPAYMSPEQATGSPLDHRTDLFSLGVLIYEMLAGKLPFDGTPVELARQNLAADPPQIADRVSGLVVDPGLEMISRRLMEKLPQDRYQSAHEVLTALDILAAGDRNTQPVTPVTPMPAASAPARPGIAADMDARAHQRAAARGVDVFAATQGIAEEQPGPATPPRLAGAVSPGRAGAGAASPGPVDKRPAEALTERVRAGRPWPWIVAAAALLSAAVVLLLLLGRNHRDTARAQPSPGAADRPARPSTAGQAHAAAPVRAGLDAGSAVAEPAADPAAGPPAGIDTAIDAGPASAQGPAPTPEDAGTRRRSRRDSDSMEASDLEAVYKRVGKKLPVFEREHGAAAARPFWDVYLSIPLHDALRTPSLGEESLRKLHRIERDLAAAQSAPR